VRQLEGLVAEGRPEDRAVPLGQVPKLSVGARDLAVDVVVNEGKGASLEGGGAEEQSAEVLSSPGDGVFEELPMGRGTLKWSSSCLPAPSPSVTSTTGFCFFCTS
jgi:hypothetical protein